MKSKVNSGTIYILFFLAILVSCKKTGTPPTVETSPVTEVSTFSAMCGGSITSEGSSPVVSRGVCWAAKLNPTINDLKTQDGSGSGSYISTIAGLKEGIAYFVRAYATNNAGTSYGAMKSFIANGQTPTVTVSPATNISSTSATLNGLVNPHDLITTVIFKYGINLVYDSTAVAIEGPLNETIEVGVSANVVKLIPATLYHYRIIATNSLGTTFGSDITFTTKSK